MAVRVARSQGLAAALAMTPRQAETFLHFADAFDWHDEVTAIQTTRLAGADQKVLDKYLKEVDPR